MVKADLKFIGKFYISSVEVVHIKLINNKLVVFIPHLLRHMINRVYHFFIKLFHKIFSRYHAGPSAGHMV